MTKKRFSKMLSVILIFAICATTLFSCLITANAAMPCYAWSDGKVLDNGQTATINLTVKAPSALADGFLAAEFTFSQDIALTLTGIEVASITAQNGAVSEDAVSVDLDKETNICIVEQSTDAIGASNFVTELVLKLTYSGNFAKGKKYKVNVKSMKLADGYNQPYNETATDEVGVIKFVCNHVYDDENDTDCNVCGAVRVFKWKISVEKTGIYTILPIEDIDGFTTDTITIVDKNENEVMYNETHGGFPLVKGELYTVKLSDTADKEDYEYVKWNITLKSSTIFPDTTADGWYNDAVTYAVGAGIMTGYQSNGLFGTSDSIQRQDFTVMLARYAGADLSAYANAQNIFPDVDNNGYYAAAVKWGVDKGIITGYTHNGMFGVGDSITREQLVTMLYRYAKNVLGKDVTVSADAATNATEKFNDYNNVTLNEGVLWATEKGVITGKGENHDAIDPQGNAQRCEVAQIMYNIFKNDIL